MNRVRRLFTAFSFRYSLSPRAIARSYGSSASEEAALTLHTGARLPLVGFGTWNSPLDVLKRAVLAALDAGYRHVDCAASYYNQTAVGEALNERLNKICTRQDLFIASKLWNTYHSREDVRPACLHTLKELDLDYLDLYLIHWPVTYMKSDDKIPLHPDGSVAFSYVHYTETWAALEELVDEGLVRHIGLSNFNSQQIDEIMAMARIQPAVLQVECHPYLNQKRLISHVAKYNIITTGYSPLGSPERPWAEKGEPTIMDNPVVTKIAKRHKKTPAQVLIRFQMERKVCTIPKSVTPERIKSNFDVFDFSLSQEDMMDLEYLDRNWRGCIPSDEIDGKYIVRDFKHPFYPFHIAY